MKISVCVTVFNEEDNIGMMIESLLVQSKKPDEVVIVDGGSTDRTVDVIRKYQQKHKHVRLVTKKCSRSEGRNIAISKAKNGIIAITDAGCVAKTDWLEEITKPFKDHSIDVVAGFYNMVGEKPIQKANSVFLGVMPQQFDENFLPSTRSMALKKSVWEDVGGFPEELSDTAEDTLFNYRILKNNFHIKRVKNARVGWRMPENITDTYSKMYAYAKGDAQSGLLIFPGKGIASHNIKILLKFIRYYIALALLVMGLIFNPASLVLLIALIIIYSAYSFVKVYKKTGCVRAGVWGLLLQYISDIYGMGGYLKGKYEGN